MTTVSQLCIQYHEPVRFPCSDSSVLRLFTGAPVLPDMKNAGIASLARCEETLSSGHVTEVQNESLLMVKRLGRSRFS